MCDYVYMYVSVSVCLSVKISVCMSVCNHSEDNCACVFV